jgi:hypothetical protein
MLVQDRQFVQLVDIACVSATRYTKLEVSNVLMWRVPARLYTKLVQKSSYRKGRDRSRPLKLFL